MDINFQKAEFLTSWFATSALDLPRKPEIIFTGRSNVGKSSMINKLLNRKSLVKTSQKPGKTVSANYFEIDSKMYIVDLPGYGYAERSKEQRKNWGSLVDKYFELDRDVRMIAMLVDSRHEPTENDILMYRYLMSKNFLFFVAATKTDKLNSTEKAANLKSLSEAFGVEVIPFSALTGEGVEQLKAIICDACEPEDGTLKDKE